MNGSVAGRMRWEREGRTESLKRTCMRGTGVGKDG
jgi:hypothetical protein